MAPTRISRLFQVYVEGAATPEERAELFALVRSGQQDAGLQEEIHALWARIATQQHLPPSTANAIFERIVGDLPPADGNGKRNDKSMQRVWPWLRIAVAAMLLAVVGAGAYWRLVSDRAVTHVQLAEHATSGHRIIKLADGSTVMLHEGSELHYPETFAGARTREVRLVGEAYFAIESDPSQPFVVWTGTTMTTVLGTAFTIRQGDAGEVKVTVQRGSVRVADGDRDFGVLEAEQEVVVRADAPVAPIVAVAVAEAVPVWVQQVVYFDDITMAEAAAELERRFGVRVVFASEAVARCRFTAGFVKGEQLERILKVITVFNNADYSYEKHLNTVRISGDGCAAQE